VTAVQAHPAAASPLSFGQQRMWLLSEVSHGASALSLVMAVRLTGRLNWPALRQALDYVAKRHEVLRSVIVLREGEPVQVPGPHRRVPIRVVDLRGLLAHRAEQQVDRMLSGEARRPFDLEHGPVVRATAFLVGPNEHVVGLAMHHVVTDGWSMSVLMQDVAALYRAYLAGRPGPLAGLPKTQYRDFVRWQRERAEAHTAEQAAWVDSLRGLTGGGVPLDHAPDATGVRGRGHAAAVWTIALPPSLTNRLGELRRREGGSLFMLILAALMTVVHRVDGRHDVAVGVFSSGRTRPEFESLIGYLVNVLVVRAEFANGVTFREAWRNVRDACVAAYTHQDLPYEKLLEQLAPDRTGEFTPPVSVLCVLQPPAPPVDLPGLLVEPLDVPHATARFDLTLEVRERAGGTELAFQYDTDVLDLGTVERLGRYVRAVLASAVQDLDMRCGEVIFDGPGTYHSPARPQAPVEGTLDGLFESQAARTPDAIAVAHHGAALSYGRLNALADLLARRLNASGVGLDDRVGIYQHRGLDSVVAILAVLRAGATYVPLDPAYPAERIDLILADSDVRLVLTSAALRERLDSRIPTMLIGDPGGSATDSRAGPRGPRPSPDNSAYLLYTSGSTGRPKGVLGTHRGMVNRLRWMWRAHPYRSGERACHRTSLSFVDSVTELLGPLLAGVPVEIVDHDEVTQPARLVEHLRRCGVTRVVVVPSLLRVLLDTVPDIGGWLGSTAVWICSGERLPADLAARFHAALPGHVLLNLYGSTEVAGDATWAPVPVGCDAVPLGRPIDGVTATVVDVNGRQAPTLAAGELYIGGLAVARGYHRRPADTASRFVPDPAGVGPGARAFRTADRARRGHAGDLRFLGRLDDQLQVRGIRVEPGEIEDALLRHTAVAQAAVTAWPDPAGTSVLAGYVVLASACPVAELLAHLRERLAPHLVPSALIQVDALPRTSSGKLDRSGLPPPGADPGPLEVQRPRGPAEQAVADVFAELLPVRWQSVDDDFFALGGHSILAIAAVYQLHQRCGVELTMNDIFAERTIAGVARRLTEHAPADSHADAGSLTTSSGDQHEPFPLTEVQQAYWLGRSAGFDLGSVATHSYFEVNTADLDVGRLSTALRRLIERHPALRTVVRPDGMQQVLREVPRYDLPVVDLRSAQAGEIDRALASVRDELSHQVLPADRWPLFDLRVSLLAGNRARIYVSIDALIADAYSVRILMDELAELYHDPAVSLKPVRLTFRDCVLAGEAARNSAGYAASLEYWRERLRSLPPGPELPLAQAPSAVTRPRFQRWSAQLDHNAWHRIRQRAAEAGLSPPAVVLAAFAEVVTLWSASAHYTLTLTLFTRPPGHPDTAHVVGDFTSLTLLEVDHRAAGTFLTRARSLHQRMWQDLDHRLVGGVTVLRELTRMRGGRPELLAPVVFTSNLGLDVAPATPRRRQIGELGFTLTQTPQLYLDHQVAETPDGLSLSWDVVAELFPPGLVDDMHEAYVRLLTDLAERPDSWDRPVGDLLPAPQRQRRAAVNATVRPRETGCLHTIVGHAAARTPDATAIVTPERRLSFGELITRAARVSHRLRELGVGPGELVGIGAAKGWEQVVAVLGVTAAGAAYVPIDPDLPAARVDLLRRQTRLRYLLTQAALRDRRPGLDGVTQLAVDDPGEWAGQPDTWAPEGNDDTTLAYVIFTSGSTGTPKGVMIDHRGAVNTVTDINRRFDVGPRDRVLGLSSLSFDLSVYDIFGVLAAGGALVLPDPRRLSQPGHWLRLLADEGVTLWNSVPALMGLTAEHAAPEVDGLARLRLVLLSGDWIPVDLPDRLRWLARHATVVSLGGATEASIWSVFHPVDRTDPARVSIPYGRPLSNQRLHVFDGRLVPRPDWVPGDLYIAGDGLALGYWADPDGTARSFPAHPETGERLYRTGDLARYLPDGNLEFLGRADRQVKINGYRVELSEIESTLAEVPGVAGCAVVAVGPIRGEKRLAAFVVADPGVALDATAVRQQLRAALPSYLVPTTYTSLLRLPLTSNGKVDVAALAAQSAPDADPGIGAEPAPVDVPDDLTSALTQIWAFVLGVESVDPHDSFFELGGTSLVAIRLLARLKASYGLEIPLVRLYEAPTVAQLAAEMTRSRAERGDTVANETPLTADPGRRHEPFPLTAIQEAYWIGRRRALRFGGVATHSYVELDVTDLDVDRLDRAVQALVNRHDALRTVALADGRQQVLPDVPPYRTTRTDVRGLSTEQRQAVLDELRARLSHLVLPADAWPLFDIHATWLDSHRTRLHIGVDLLIADALSFRILQHELLGLYQRPDAALRPLGCTFRDYVNAVQQRRGGAAYRRAERYWTDRLAALPQSPPLPLANGGIEPRFQRLEGGLDAADWAMLIDAAATRKLTPSGLLCAAFADVLAMWSQSGRFTLNLTTFNRLPLHPDIDAVVGDFTSTTLLAVDATAQTFAARAARLQHQVFADLEHRQFGGVEALRLLRTDPRRRGDALAPIVFTSMLDLEVAGPESTTAWDATPVYSVSQTPQVLIDHQVSAHAGRLTYTWDYVRDAFPNGMVEAMFDAYGQLLRSLLNDGAYWEAAPGWTT
jgi:amino acid adenylation domain-containing protein